MDMEELILLIVILISKKRIMKNILNKTLIIMTIGIAFFTNSCINDDDFDIPTLKPVIYSQDFETITPGSGSSEIAIDLPGWVNTNATSTRIWSGKSFNGSKFAEFSSFYSNAGTSDTVWLITEALDLSSSIDARFSFTSVNRFYNGAVLEVLISEDYDGTIPGIATATWTMLNPTLPTSSTQNDAVIKSGAMNISSFNSANVRIAFKYKGSKSANPTTTFQLDNIKIFEN